MFLYLWSSMDPHSFIIHVWVVNQYFTTFFCKFIKISSALIKYYVHIFLFNSVHGRGGNSNGQPFGSPCTIHNNFVLIHVIMPQWILFVHSSLVFVMISNNFRILEPDYLPIHRPSLFLITLWLSQTWKSWFHNNVIIIIF